MTEARVWRWFSRYIRLRDADESGLCRCFTCGRVALWTQMDCGHGVGRQHKATKYNVLNNHAQCKRCNGFEEGRKDVYSRRVDELYGSGTWEKLLIASRQTMRRTRHDFVIMEEQYKTLAKDMAKKKGQKI